MLDGENDNTLVDFVGRHDAVGGSRKSGMDRLAFQRIMFYDIFGCY